MNIDTLIQKYHDGELSISELESLQDWLRVDPLVNNKILNVFILADNVWIEEEQDKIQCHPWNHTVGAFTISAIPYYNKVPKKAFELKFTVVP